MARRAAFIILLAALALKPAAASAADPMKGVVDGAIRPLMQKYDVAGMAVGVITVRGAREFDYGLASREARTPVTPQTLFEIGSISKTFAATLAAWADATGALALSDSVSRHVPELRGGPFDRVSVINLATHTPGGMPLQFPKAVDTDGDAMSWFKAWKPAYAAGTMRTYANPSISLLGLTTERSLGEPYAAALKRHVIAPLGLKHTFLDIPAGEMSNYAEGYSDENRPIRMTMGPLGAQAYGIRITAGDLMRYAEAQMGLVSVDPTLARALAATHVGYFRAGSMTQDLVWEQYPWPTPLSALEAGNGETMIFQPNPATRIDPPLRSTGEVLLNKTGSTNGFGAYVAFIPGRRLGIVMLANRSLPIGARVAAAYAILTALDHDR